uniref:HCR1 n=1 Tax=Alvikia littoralis TaxID=56200 RepID=O22112_ALVLI|nr:HCR1 [Alvikia littoralis]
MMNRKIAVASVLLAFVAAGSVAGSVFQDTTGLMLGPFKFSGNVAGYVNMTLDYCDIQAALYAGDTATALEIYNFGKNSERGAAFRSFALWAEANHTGQIFYDALGLPSETYLTDVFSGAAGDGDATMAMAVIDAIKIKYMFHEWDTAVSRTASGNPDPSYGAPHNLDEAAAMYFAGTEGQCQGASVELHAMNQAAMLKGMLYFGSSPSNTLMSLSFINAQDATLTNNTAKIESAYATFLNQMQVLQLQRLYTDAALLSYSCKCGNTTISSETILVSWMLTHQMLQMPQLTGMTVNHSTIETIDFIIENTEECLMSQAIEIALKDVVMELGYEWADIFGNGIDYEIMDESMGLECGGETGWVLKGNRSN